MSGHRCATAVPLGRKWRPSCSSPSPVAVSPPGGVVGPAMRACDPVVRPSAAAAPPSTSGLPLPFGRRPLSWSGRSKIFGVLGRRRPVGGRTGGGRGVGGGCGRRRRSRARGWRSGAGCRRRGRRGSRACWWRGRAGCRRGRRGRSRRCRRRRRRRGSGARGGRRPAVRRRPAGGLGRRAALVVSCRCLRPSFPVRRAGVVSFPSTTTYPATCPGAGASRPRASPPAVLVSVGSGSTLGLTNPAHARPARCRRRRHRVGARGPRGPRPRCVTRTAARSTGTGARRSRVQCRAATFPSDGFGRQGFGPTHQPAVPRKGGDLPERGETIRPWASVTDEWPS